MSWKVRYEFAVFIQCIYNKLGFDENSILMTKMRKGDNDTYKNTRVNNVTVTLENSHRITIRNITNLKNSNTLAIAKSFLYFLIHINLYSSVVHYQLQIIVQ